MISTWNIQTKLKYGIFVSGYFFNPSTAEVMMAKLPADISGNAEVITGWPAETKFYADPMAGKGY